MNDDNVRQFQDIVDGHDKLTHGLATNKDFEKFVKIVLQIINELRDETKTKLENESGDIKRETQSQITDINYSIDTIELKLKDLLNNSEKNTLGQVKELSKRIYDEIKRVEKEIPEVKDHSFELSRLEALIESIDKKIVAPEKIEGAEIVDAINELEITPALQIDASHIKNLPEFTKEIGSRIGWGAHPLQIQDDGVIVSKVARVINFIGATIDTDPSGIINIEVTGGTGGGSGYQEAIGDVDGVNDTFTFDDAPKVIVVDGVTIRQTSSNGTSNWSGTTTITLKQTVPTVDIFGLVIDTGGGGFPG